MAASTPPPPRSDPDALTPAQAWRLYLSHFLSMWNSRTYEYAAILFIQAAFPGDLLPSSINGIAETVCVLVSAAALGRWVDREPSRLRPLILTIVLNRLSLVVCCLLWILLFIAALPALRIATFVVLLALGMVEKASRMANTLAVEREWVPTLADPDGDGAKHAYSLTHLNTVVRRIDICCKFLAPLVISAVVAQLEATPAAMAMAAFSIVSMALELGAAMQVWKHSRRLQSAKQEIGAAAMEVISTARRSGVHKDGGAGSMPFLLWGYLQGLVARCEELVHTQIDGLRYYFSTPVWIPSVGVAVLHASVLAWSGTLITWLLNAGFSLPQVTVAKGVGSVFEIGSTLVFPWAVGFLRHRSLRTAPSTAAYRMVEQHNPDEEGESSDAELDVDGHDEPPSGPSSSNALHQSVVQVALWAISGLFLSLVPTVIALFYLAAQMPGATTDASAGGMPPPSGPAAVAAIAFFTFLSFSFLGRWTYDLAVTQLTLMLVPATHRSSFGGTEMALVSSISLVHWSAAAIWHAQANFRWLALASFGAVGIAAVAYTRWSRRWLHEASQL